MNPMAANTGGSNPMGFSAGPPQGLHSLAHAGGGGAPPLGPQAQQIQSQGRGEDTQLIHMTKNEVDSLAGLAHHMGGQLTTNPHTGLPEAGWLGKLLPTLIGFGLNFIPGVGPLLSAGLVAAGQTAITGDLKKGLMSGLQAFGGASMAGALAPGATAGGSLGGLFGGGAKAAATGASGLGSVAGAPGSALAGIANAAPAATTIGTDAIAAGVQGMGGGLGGAASGLGSAAGSAGSALAGVANAAPAATTIGSDAIAAGVQNMGGGLGSTAQAGNGILGKFGAAARGNLTGTAGKIAPWAAGAGLVSTMSDLTKPGAPKAPAEAEKPNLNFKAAPRKVIVNAADVDPTGKIAMPDLSRAPPPVSDRPPLQSGERQWFDNVNPMPNIVPLDASEIGPSTNTKSTTTSSKKSSSKDSRYGFDDNRWNFASGGQTGGKGGAQQSFSPPQQSQSSMQSAGGMGGGKGGSQQGGMMGAQMGGMPGQGSSMANAYADFQQAQGQTSAQSDLAQQMQSQLTAPGAPPPPAEGAPATDVPPPTAETGFAAQMEAYRQSQQPQQLPQQAQQSMAAQAAQAQPGLTALPPQQLFGMRNTSSQTQYPPMFQGGGQPQQVAWNAPQLSQAGNFSQQAQSPGGKGGGSAGTAATALRQKAQSPGGKGGSGAQPRQFARGGKVLQMEEGGHVIPAFDVATYGNGSTVAGQNHFRKIGGIPIKGKGDGVSDSIPAVIGKGKNQQKARVADGEVYIPPKAVAKAGGNKALYKMMAAAQQARMKTPSGEKVQGLI